MAFEAPDLNINLSTIAQINANMTLIETAFQQLQNLIPQVSIQRQGGNLGLLDRLIRPDGVVGHQSFTPSFGTDGDRFAVFHDSPNGKSTVIIDTRIHENDSAFDKAMTDVVLSNGDFEVVFGVRTLGAPALEMLLELETTDKVQTVTIYSMDVNRSGSLITVTNFRRVAPVHINRDSWGKVLDFDNALAYQHEARIPIVAGPLPTGFVIPWPCEVTGASMRLEIPPQQLTDANDLVIELNRIRGTDAVNVLAGQATFTTRDGVGQIQNLSPITPENFQLDTDDYVYPNVITPEFSGNQTDVPPRAQGLSVTLLLRRIYTPILRS